MAKAKRSDLDCSSIHSKPNDIDWAEARGEDGDGWEAYGAETCEGCGASIVLEAGRGGEQHRHVDDESECRGHVPMFEGPMMSYWYPLGADATEEDAAKLSGPVCLVRVGNEWGLALTGGGMDLSWEICAAFIALGFRPPVHFCDLPNMATKMTPAREAIVVECMESCRIAASWLKRSRDNLAGMLKKGKVA